MSTKTLFKTLALVVAMLMVGAFGISGNAIAGGDEEREFKFERAEIFEDELELEDVGISPLMLLLLGIDLEDLFEEEEEEELELERLGIDID